MNKKIDFADLIAILMIADVMIGTVLYFSNAKDTIAFQIVVNVFLSLYVIAIVIMFILVAAKIYLFILKVLKLISI